MVLWVKSLSYGSGSSHYPMVLWVKSLSYGSLGQVIILWFSGSSHYPMVLGQVIINIF